VVAFHSLHSVVSSISSVTVHLEGYMLRNRALLKGADEKLAKLAHSPFSGRRLDDNPPKKG
jgi:hypothetical protein